MKTAIGENTVGEAKELMQDEGIHAIPIVQYEKQLPENDIIIQGIVTATDLNRVGSDAVLLKEIMTPNVHVIHKDSSAKAAAKMLLKHKVHHIVVMDDGKIIGMISSLDFVKLVSEHTLD